MAVIALLVSILLPSLSMAKENGWDVHCRANMGRLSQIMLSEGAGKLAGQYPSPSAWVSFVTGQGGAGLLRCPKDGREMDENNGPVLDDVYILQRHKSNFWYSYLQDILAGADVPDEQISLNPAPTSHQGDRCFCDNWYPFAQRARKPNENVIAMDDDAAVMITEKSNGWLFESLNPEGDAHCASDHWLCKGDGGSDWQDEVLMRLTGDHYQNKIDDPVFLKGSSWSSYGMNSQVPARHARSGQLLLVEYHNSTVHVDPGGNYVDDFMDTEKFLAPRHLDKRRRANMAFADGSVRWMHPDELDPENQPEGRNIWTP
jgi:prepilin-type processing-associated H-X9-DG protein